MDTAAESSDNATWEDRVELALRGFLQSPHFVYRIEASGRGGAAPWLVKTRKRRNPNRPLL